MYVLPRYIYPAFGFPTYYSGVSAVLCVVLPPIPKIFFSHILLAFILPDSALAPTHLLTSSATSISRKFSKIICKTPSSSPWTSPRFRKDFSQLCQFDCRYNRSLLFRNYSNIVRLEVLTTIRLNPGQSYNDANWRGISPNDVSDVRNRLAKFEQINSELTDAQIQVVSGLKDNYQKAMRRRTKWASCSQ